MTAVGAGADYTWPVAFLQPTRSRPTSAYIWHLYIELSSTLEIHNTHSDIAESIDTLSGGFPPDHLRRMTLHLFSPWIAI